MIRKARDNAAGNVTVPRRHHGLQRGDPVHGKLTYLAASMIKYKDFDLQCVPPNAIVPLLTTANWRGCYAHELGAVHTCAFSPRPL